MVRGLQDRHVNLAILIGGIAIAVRLIAINQPFVDKWSWRQSDVAAIARNFYTNGFHFAYPQIDWAGDQPGYVGTEFPILPFIAALCYKVVGVHEWVGRVQAVILFAASLPFFFLLVREIFGATAATCALFFYSFAPLSVMTSRCFMPDMPSLSLSIIGLYFFTRWIDHERSTSLLAAAALVSLSILIKAPSALIGAPLAYLAFQRFGVAAFRRMELWLFATIALVPSAIWYWHAHNIAERFYPHHFFGAGGIKLENFTWYWEIATRTFTTSLTPPLFLLALGGLFLAPRPNKYARLFHWWLVAMILFVIVVGYGNRHPWYQLPLVPIAAAFAGAACVWFSAKTTPFFVPLAGLVMTIWLLLCYFNFLAPVHASLYLAGLELKQSTAKSDLLVVANYGDPNVFYYAERKGWHFLEIDGVYDGHPIDSADAVADLEKLRKRGATHLVFYSGTFWWLDYYKEFAEHVDQTATLMEATPQFKIYKLNPP
jgi:4-amino-4-deoxy-L-arabinose transferase-like glycosyltransferase